MKIQLNKKDILNKIFDPLSSITENCILNITPTNINTTVYSKDIGIYLHIIYNNPINITEPIILNIGNINKLTKMINFINDDIIDIDINSNNIFFDTDKVKFKYHLLDDNVIIKPKINIESAKNYKYDCEFNIITDKMNSLIKASSIASKNNKLYFWTKEGKVFAEINDYTQSNIDSISININDSYIGSEIINPIPYKFEIIKVISQLYKVANINCKFNFDKQFMLMSINGADYSLTYLIQGMTK